MAAAYAHVTAPLRRLVDRFGSRPPLIIGPAIAACGFALFALPGRGGSYWTTFFPAAAIASLVIAVNLIADSVQSVLEAS